MSTSPTDARPHAGTRRSRLRRLWGTVALALAVAIVATLVLAAVAALRATAPQGYREAGFYRLLLAETWQRFDHWLPAVAAGVLAAAALARQWGIRRPPRRIARSALALVLTVAALRVLSIADAYRPGRPNLLLISIDTLRADHLGAYGHPLATSPTIDDRLAGEGVTFDDVFSQSPKTTPSHMTLLTSLYPCAHGVNLWVGDAPGRVLSPAVHTLAEILKNAGYATAAFTGGAQMDHSRGFDQGFDVYEDDGGQLGHAVRWMKHHRRQRFFVLYHTYDVHDPYVPPARLVSQFGEGYDGPVLAAVRQLQSGAGAWEDRHRVFWSSVDRTNARDVRFLGRLYDAGIRAMDEQTIAPLLDHLEALGLTRRTLVVFTSDHGEAFGEHGGFLHEDLHRETLRVPLVLRLPGTLPAGRHVRERVRLLDVTPTVLDLLGVTPPPSLQGRSLAPLVREGAAPPPGSEAVISEYTTDARPYASVRRGPLAFIADGSSEHLFDLDADPEERTDLGPARPEAVAAMREVLARWRDECRPLAARFGPRGETVLPDDPARRRLRALGYLD